MLTWITVAVAVFSLVLHWIVTYRYRDHLGTPNSRGIEVAPERQPPTLRHPYIRLADFMMVFVSVAVLCSSLFIILSGRYDDAAQKWAFGSVGSVLGFWLRRAR